MVVPAVSLFLLHHAHPRSLYITLGLKWSGWHLPAIPIWEDRTSILQGLQRHV